MPAWVVGASESAERDRAAIDRGTPSRVLMERAGAAASAEIERRYSERLKQGVAVFTGVGPFQHNDPRDRPPDVFGKTVTLHCGPSRPSHLLLPIIPAR